MSLIKRQIEGDALDRVGRSSALLETWIRSATGDIAHGAGEYIKRGYLIGQALSKRSGLTYGSVKQFYAKREKAWYLRPGVGVRGSLNYLAKWIGTDKEFMKPGFDAYLNSWDVEGAIIKKIEAKL